MNKTHIRIAILYVFLITFFSGIYYFFTDLWDSPKTLVDSFYFSVVTITTLGYGDISPKTDWGKVIAATQSLLGVVSMGWFLVALGNHQVNRIQLSRKNSLKNNLKGSFNVLRARMLEIWISAIEIERRSQFTLQDKSILQVKLENPEKFRLFYESSSNWFDTLNGLQHNESLISEMYMEIDIYLEQFRMTLHTIETDSSDSLTNLSGYLNDLIRLKKGRHTSHDSEYLVTYMYDLFANKSHIDSSTVLDKFLSKIDSL